jgi:hypothetical protein
MMYYLVYTQVVSGFWEHIDHGIIQISEVHREEYDYVNAKMDKSREEEVDHERQAS